MQKYNKDPKERRHCILGYIAALANEKGGKLVFGMKDHRPHEVVGSTFEQGNLGALEDAIYNKMQIRVSVDKVRYSLSKLESLKVLKREGTGKGTKYYIVSIPENIDL